LLLLGRAVEKGVVCGDALAAVAVSTGAMAQATITGNINYGMSTVNGAASGNGNTVGFHDTNLTIAASEDLGGGMRVSGSATLETAAGGGVRGGTLNFADRSMSLAGDFGTITLANTRSSNLATSAGVFGAYLRRVSWDQNASGSTGLPSNDTGSGVATRVAGNLVAYTTPELVPGLRLNASLFMIAPATLACVTAATGASVACDGAAQTVAANLADQKARVATLGATYVQGPLSIAAAYKSNNKAAREFNPAATGKASVTELNARYDLGVAQVGLGYATANTTTAKHLMVVGVNAPVTEQLTVGLNYGKRDKAKYSELGATYALSKRTNIAAHTGQFRAQTAAKSVTQSRVSLRHAF